jgi:hypothetical protein
VIDFPVHTDPSLQPPLDVTTITGDITLRSGFFNDNRGISVAATGLTVYPGAILRLEGFTLFVHGRLTVQGTLFVDRSAVVASTTITEGGALFAVNSLVIEGEEIPAGDSMIMNAGTLAVRFSQLSTTQPMLYTAPGATSIIGASWIQGPQTGACTGAAVTSEGFNVDYTGFEVDQGEWTDRCTDDPEVSWREEHEAVPHGVLGCGTTVVVDYAGSPRPVDHDGDGDPRCGIGSLESSFG